MGVHSAFRAYLRSRWLHKRLDNRKAIKAYHEQALQKLTQHLTISLPFYLQEAAPNFESLPIIDKQVLLENYADLNLPNIDLETVKAAISDRSFKVSEYKIGHSTGTSGNRGYYIISDRERYVWLGTILAKTLPNALWTRQHVALILPGMSSLYSAARKGSRVNIRFFDLSVGLAIWESDLDRFSPDTIVAPPKVLRHLAEAGTLKSINIFSCAEVLDPLDKAVIEDKTGQIVRQIYMATEGLFGVSCRFGTLHLAEDVVHFEWESVSGSTLLSPIVTDFTRRTQAMARYRMNDLLELSSEPCPCGSAFQAVKRIEGRADDVFQLRDKAGKLSLVTPDILRNKLIDVSSEIQDFRIIQTGPANVEIRLNDNLVPLLSNAIQNAFFELFQTLKLAETKVSVKAGLTPTFDRKLRRVRREWSS